MKLRAPDGGKIPRSYLYYRALQSVQIALSRDTRARCENIQARFCALCTQGP